MLKARLSSRPRRWVFALLCKAGLLEGTRVFTQGEAGVGVYMYVYVWIVDKSAPLLKRRALSRWNSLYALFFFRRSLCWLFCSAWTCMDSILPGTNQVLQVIYNTVNRNRYISNTSAETFCMPSRATINTGTEVQQNNFTRGSWSLLNVPGLQATGHAELGGTKAVRCK